MSSRAARVGDREAWRRRYSAAHEGPDGETGSEAALASQSTHAPASKPTVVRRRRCGDRRAGPRHPRAGARLRPPARSSETRPAEGVGAPDARARRPSTTRWRNASQRGWSRSASRSNLAPLPLKVSPVTDLGSAPSSVEMSMGSPGNRWRQTCRRPCQGSLDSAPLARAASWRDVTTSSIRPILASRPGLAFSVCRWVVSARLRVCAGQFATDSTMAATAAGRSSAQVPSSARTIAEYDSRLGARSSDRSTMRGGRGAEAVVAPRPAGVTQRASREPRARRQHRRQRCAFALPHSSHCSLRLPAASLRVRTRACRARRR